MRTVKWGDGKTAIVTSDAPKQQKGKAPPIITTREIEAPRRKPKEEKSEEAK